MQSNSNTRKHTHTLNVNTLNDLMINLLLNIRVNKWTNQGRKWTINRHVERFPASSIISRKKLNRNQW